MRWLGSVLGLALGLCAGFGCFGRMSDSLPGRGSSGGEAGGGPLGADTDPAASGAGTDVTAPVIPAGGGSSSLRNGVSGGAAATAPVSSAGAPGWDSICPGSQLAEFIPNYLVFVYDSSNSMGDDPNGGWGNSASRWKPMLAGMTEFFQIVDGFGSQASLVFFPAPGDEDATCHYDYSRPAVASTSLTYPENRKLIDAMNAQRPQGGSPTLPALVGAIKYANRLVNKTPGSKAAVILVTDGEPYPASYTDITGSIVGCAPTSDATLQNTVADIVSVVATASGGSPRIPTYVIGIGDADRSSMQRISEAGGTELVYIDTALEPSKTQATVLSTLTAIRSSQIDCSLRVPSRDFEPNFTNYSFLHSDGTRRTLGISEDCSLAGWHYDSRTNPTRVILCPQLCTELKQDPKGTIESVQACTKIAL